MGLQNLIHQTGPAFAIRAALSAVRHGLFHPRLNFAEIIQIFPQIVQRFPRRKRNLKLSEITGEQNPLFARHILDIPAGFRLDFIAPDIGVSQGRQCFLKFSGI